MAFDELMRLNIISDAELNAAMHAAIYYWSTDAFNKQTLVTQRDVETGSQLLDRVERFLEGRK
jgi:hypothetical protein